MFDGDKAVLVDVGGEYAGKSLYERVTGRFYTPDHLAADLAGQVIEALGSLPRELAVSDPFCGDGQLVKALLCRLAELPSPPRLRICLFDQEAQAVATAKDRVEALASQLSLTVKVQCHVGDSFTRIWSGEFDAVITNPPWELLKPDRREMAYLSSPDRAAYRDWLASRCAALDALLPEAVAEVSWAGWGTNLARCGWAVSLRGCRPGGVVGIVLPGTLMGDQASVGMRKHALTSAHLIDVAAYPAEARLFAKVDQPVVAATFRKVAPKPGSVSRVRLHSALCELQSVTSPLSLAFASEPNGYTIPVGFGAARSDVLSLFDGLPTFREMEGTDGDRIWAGRELDETRIADRLIPGASHPFVKGRMIQRFQVVEPPSDSVSASDAARFRSAKVTRIVWRDVARASQRRRMISATIPPGWVAGNSLHVAHFRDGDEHRLQALLAVMSSYVFEFLVRARLTTGHMSLGVVRRAQLPLFTPATVADLSRAVSSVDASDLDQIAMEVSVAKVYGLTRDTFEAILKQFPKVLPAERESLLDRDRWASR